jgi:hypothetical protein
MPEHIQAEPIEKEVSEHNAEIDIGEMELFEDSSDGNDTDSSFGIIEGENEVKINYC